MSVLNDSCVETLIPENYDFFPRQVYSDHNCYHLQYDKHTNNATSLHLFGIKEKHNISGKPMNNEAKLKKFIWKLQMRNRRMHLILRWRLTLNKRRIQNPVEYLRWTFFAKLFKDWLIITRPFRKVPAQVLLSQYLLVQSQERKAQKNLWNLFKVNYKDIRVTS